ncbi:formate--tetrahydrofolate ligase [Ottowia sp.]|uniref:formate--tetrahydrofolate ligase n=1 Tax=Ottowia sp. TaxID=1898956 RepID=UPI002CE6E7F9|nr:formate--tetrahydrofolate ligase [Ottowia sp.]HRN74225.1 formate--tetrahydrofolate ligase [Ottowia sp.]HRQ01415.1 formate--tetrahydrofolate ligase [Ottowia sp.]
MAVNDLDIARRATLRRITDVARDKLGVGDEHLAPYGHYKAKIGLPYLESLQQRPDGQLILITATSPTPAGEGKTTAAIGLADGMNLLGHQAVLALREPSIGPVFGMKGGAAGGGHAQVVPMEDINLHFTGDFHAIALANNLLAAVIDNHIHQGNALGIDVRRIHWRRVMDMNDRALRHIALGLGGPANGVPREGGFDIVAASEVMAILCLARSLADLKARLGRIVVAETRERQPVRAADLRCHGAMAVLLKDALAPNLVQTLENNPALLHGGPFGNIAHGCNSVIATRAAMKLGNYAITEAGFGADLGAEKFIDIKCRMAGLQPSIAVLVTTVRALKMQGGVPLDALAQENLAALDAGLANLDRHLHIVREVFGLPCVVAANHFVADSAAEHALLRERMAARGVPYAVSRHWTEGGAGAVELAREVVALCQRSAPRTPRFVYDDGDSLWDKVTKVATRVYGAAQVTASPAAQARIAQLQADGWGHLAVCVAKTQYSFSTDPKLLGAPSGHSLHIREVRLSAGAGFIVLVCGDIMTMPGLPARPGAEGIDLDDTGQVIGLF